MITFSVINKKLPGVETPRRSPENQQTGFLAYYDKQDPITVIVPLPPV